MIIDKIRKNNVIKFDDNLSLDLGTNVAIIGSNGKGKTTFLRVLSGNILPDEGNIVIDGESYNFPMTIFHRTSYQKVLRRKMIYIENQDYLYRNFTVKQNIDYYCKTSDIDRGQLFEILDKFDFNGKYVDRLVDEISLGTKQKITLALLFASRKEIILVDEPTLGLDIETKKKFMDLIKMSNHNKIIIISSNDETIIKNFDTYLYCDDNEVRKLYENPYICS